jgi:hypothetical protein
MSEIESVAMWNVYLKGNPGVAIQSSVKNLDESIHSSNAQGTVLIGKVHYLAEDDVIPEPDGVNGLNAVLWKWKSYEYENELRAVLISTPEELYKYNGIYIPVNLHQLIPVSSKYELSEKVTSSRLDIKPGSIDNNEFSIEFTCPLCSTKQEIIIEPFITREYSNNVTIVFSADRVTIPCKNCEKTLVFPVRTEMKDSDSNESRSET